MGNLTPIYLTKEQLLHIIDDIRSHVEANDSFEGSLEYGFPWDAAMGDPATDEDKSGFRVCAAYRTGNSEGQGGMRLVGVVIGS